jgi:hypothetical protein
MLNGIHISAHLLLPSFKLSTLLSKHLLSNTTEIKKSIEIKLPLNYKPVLRTGHYKKKI